MWVVSPAITLWLATISRRPAKARLEGLSKGIGEPLSPLSGGFGKRSISCPSAPTTTSCCGEADGRHVDAARAGDREAVGNVGRGALPEPPQLAPGRACLPIPTSYSLPVAGLPSPRPEELP